MTGWYLQKHSISASCFFISHAKSKESVMFLRWLTIIAISILLPTNLHAQQPTVASSETELETAQPPSPPSQEEQLRTLLDTIQEVETERAALSRQLKRTADTTEAQQLNEQIEQLYNRLKIYKLHSRNWQPGEFDGQPLNRRLKPHSTGNRNCRMYSAHCSTNLSN
jgi:septal ring factor EnvC (AmiA/AmiB activator)